MSLTHSPEQAPQTRHAINESIVHGIVDHHTDSITYQELTESLNLLQALLVTERDIEAFFSSLERPEQLHEFTDDYATALITPVTWWELQAHIDWDNNMDQAVLEAHRQQFKLMIEAPNTQYTEHQFKTLHPVVSQVDTNN